MLLLMRLLFCALVPAVLGAKQAVHSIHGVGKYEHDCSSCFQMAHSILTSSGSAKRECAEQCRQISTVPTHHANCSDICDVLVSVKRRLSDREISPCHIIGACDLAYPARSAPEGEAGSVYTPTVLLHGLGSSPGNIEPFAFLLRKYRPGSYVKNVQIGTGPLSSIFMPFEHQVEILCRQLTSDPLLRDGIDLVGFGAGALLGRAYVQKCSGGPAVRSYISVGGPHAGTVPLKELPGFGEYAMDGLTVSSDSYRQGAPFLKELNLEVSTENNKAYLDQLLKVEKVVLLANPEDPSVRPAASAFFLYPGKGKKGAAANSTAVPQSEDELNKEDQWKSNRSGIRTLQKNGRLVVGTVRCNVYKLEMEDVLQADPHSNPCEHMLHEIILVHLNVNPKTDL